MTQPIGFMQGRLSPLVDGKIQAFPWSYWREEFFAAASLGFGGIEWTIDAERFGENPLVTAEGRREIQRLVRDTGTEVWSVTGDCFMQAPFWKADDGERRRRLDEVRRVCDGCAEVGGRWVVVPLVDNGSIENVDQRHVLVRELTELTPMLRAAGVGIAFESDFPPERLAELIAEFPDQSFGVNLDIGNSASLGFSPDREIPLLRDAIVNVHVKDRKLGGTTVPLGTGAADLPRTFALLREVGYRGRFVLQTARAADGDHAAALCRYRDLVRELLAREPVEAHP
jgi:hexulose-6-phosphate isomerase